MRKHDRQPVGRPVRNAVVSSDGSGQYEPYPTIPLKLLERLEQDYPDNSPDITDSDRMVWFKSGQANLISVLRRRYEDQQEEVYGLK